MQIKLFDNWYVDWSFTEPTDWEPSQLTYILFMEDDDCGRKNIILKSEIPPDDRELIESRIREEL